MGLGGVGCASLGLQSRAYQELSASVQNIEDVNEYIHQQVFFRGEGRVGYFTPLKDFSPPP